MDYYEESIVYNWKSLSH